MPDYVTLPIETDPDTLIQDAFDYITGKVPTWLPSEGNLEVIMLGALAQMAAEVRDVASDVPAAIFRYFGATLLGLPPIDAVQASVPSTWTMVDNAGYTIPAGTVVGIPSGGDELVAFESIGDVVVPPGSTATAAGGVTLLAVDPGAAGSGLTGTPELIDSLSFVTAVALTAPTSGGTDAEEDDAYLNRLTAELQLLAPRPILARDFAVMARRVGGVFRATAIDGYNPADSTYNNEKYVAVAVVDENGNALSAPVKAEVDALLEAEREVNFVVNVIDPTNTSIAVTFSAVALPDQDPPSVEAAAEAAVADYLSPKTWGRNPVLSVPETEWVNETHVRYLELAEVINRVEGINYISALTFAKTGDPLATTDVIMSGAAPLPTPGAINGTVVAP